MHKPLARRLISHLLYGLFVLGTLGLALVGFLRIVPALLAIPQSYDFAAYYVASRVTVFDLPLYSDTSMNTAATTSLGVVSFPLYIYPPFFALLLQPLGNLPFDTARTLWFFINIVLLTISVVVLARPLAMPPLTVVICTIVLWLLPPVYDTFLLGQVSILLLCLTAVAVSSSAHISRRSADVLAGICLGIAAGIKLYPLVLVLPYFWYRRSTVIITTFLTAVGTFMIGILGQGVDDTYRFFTVVLPEVGGISPLPVNQSVWSICARLFTPTSFQYAFLSTDNLVSISLQPLVHLPFLATFVPLVVVVVLWGATLWIGYDRRNAELTPSELIGSVSLVSITLLATSPVTHDHYLVMLILPMLYLWQQQTSPRSYKDTILAFSVVGACLLLVLQRYWRVFLNIYPSPLVTCFGFLALVLLWGVMAYHLYRVRTAVR